MKHKRLVTLGLALLVILFNVVIPFTAQAQSFVQRLPSFGLYCSEQAVIKSGAVKFDLTDKEQLTRGIGIARSEYKVAAVDGEVEFVIPFLAKVTELPQIIVTVNEKEIDGAVWYGDNAFFSDDDYDIENTYSPVLDESIIGTLYTVTPNAATITVSLSFTERQCFIYETTNNLSENISMDGMHTWTMHNALNQSSYVFYIVGDPSGHSFDSSSEYKFETMSCKDFIGSQYKKYEEYYTEFSGGIPIDFFYSLVNRSLQNNTSIECDDLFFDSINTRRFNSYKFSIKIDSDSIIRYELPISVLQNNAYNPPIYMVEQRQMANCPTKYTIELNPDMPYIIESSVKTAGQGLRYTAETEKDFYFVFSSSKKPIDSQASTPSGLSKTQLIICIVFGIIGGIAFIMFAVLVGIIIRDKVKKK